MQLVLGNRHGMAWGVPLAPVFVVPTAVAWAQWPPTNRGWPPRAVRGPQRLPAKGVSTGVRGHCPAWPLGLCREPRHVSGHGQGDRHCVGQHALLGCQGPSTVCRPACDSDMPFPDPSLRGSIRRGARVVRYSWGLFRRPLQLI